MDWRRSIGIVGLALAAGGCKDFIDVSSRGTMEVSSNASSGSSSAAAGGGAIIATDWRKTGTERRSQVVGGEHPHAVMAPEARGDQVVVRVSTARARDCLVTVTESWAKFARYENGTERAIDRKAEESRVTELCEVAPAGGVPVVIEDDKHRVVLSATSDGTGRAEATVPVTRLADVAWLRLRAGGREIPDGAVPLFKLARSSGAGRP